MGMITTELIGNVRRYENSQIKTIQVGSDTKDSVTEQSCLQERGSFKSDVNDIKTLINTYYFLISSDLESLHPAF